jgi:hypothetical protein
MIRVVRASSVLGLVAVLLGACEFTIPDINPFDAFQDEPPPCPRVAVLKDAERITKFKPGPGRDITDIDVEGEIVGFAGDCQYNGDAETATSVKVVLQVGIEATRGPANKTKEADLKYFVRIPRYYPRADANSVFDVKANFTETRDIDRIADDKVELDVPLGGDRSAKDIDIYIGFVLTPDELEYNRQHR